MALASSLKDYPFKINYGPQDDRVRDFYVPALSRSVRYERSSGFFSSTSLSIASRGVAHLIRNKGRMRLLVGAKLSEQDVKAIEKGHDLAGRVSQSMLAGIADLEKFIQNKILRPRLQKTGALVVYDPAGHYQDVCKGLADEKLVVVDLVALFAYFYLSKLPVRQ